MSPFAGEEMRLRGQVRCLRWAKPKAGSQGWASAGSGLWAGDGMRGLGAEGTAAPPWLSGG